MLSRTTQFGILREAVPDALMGMDQKGVVRFINRQTKSLFGYNRDGLSDQSFDTLFPEPPWQIHALHREDYLPDRRNRSIGLDLEPSGRHLNRAAFPAQHLFVPHPHRERPFGSRRCVT